MAASEDTYVMGRTEAETRRLQETSVYNELPLRHFLEDSGVRPGMIVLEIGSGAGDVAIAVAKLVGPSGSVLGLDMNAEILRTAEERVRTLGLDNVAFEVADVRQEINLIGEFDALIGRFILIHIAEPAAILKRLLKYVRPGGLVAFQEADLSMGAVSYPRRELFDQFARWQERLLVRIGTERSMGLKLYHTFLDAGLPEPFLRVQATLGNAADGTPEQGAGWLRSVLPLLVQHQIASEQEVEVDTFAARLYAEMMAKRAVIMGAPLVDAWARKR